MVTVDVVPAGVLHVPGILEVWKEFMDFHRDIDPFFTRSEDAHISFGKYLEEAVKSEKTHILVAVDNAAVVAYSISEICERPPVFQDRTYGVISDLAVTSDYQRKGIGTTMLQDILQWFESHHIDRIELRVVAGNEVASSFWKKHGFQEYMRILYKPGKHDP